MFRLSKLDNSYTPPLFVMPIGKSVGVTLSRSRLKEVVACKNCTAVVEINPPAPNAIVKIGYDIY